MCEQFTPHPSREDDAKAVQEFANEMLRKLEKPKNKAKEHWRRFSLEYLMHRLRQEARELQDSLQQLATVYDVKTLADVRAEAADVANLAMMIADNAGYELDILADSQHKLD